MHMLERIVTILYLSGEPIALTDLASLLKIDQKEIESILPTIEQKVKEVGLHLLHNGDELSIVTDPAQAPLVEQFWKEELKGDLTPATLQVLTIIAYLGSPTRQQISFVRGVQSSQSIRTLAVRGLIRREGEICILTSDALKQLGVLHVTELPQYETIHADLVDKMKSLEA